MAGDTAQQYGNSQHTQIGCCTLLGPTVLRPFNNFKSAMKYYHLESLFIFVSWNIILCRVGPISINQIDFQNLAETRNHTCDELKRWITSEKHYSNDIKNGLFILLVDRDCRGQPYIDFKEISYERASRGTSNGIFHYAIKLRCSVHDDRAVLFLSNYSINHNYSHFLHALLRLFCALIDSKWIVWDHEKQSFIQAKSFTLWIDPSLRVDQRKMEWINFLSPTVRLLSNMSLLCVSASQLLYGSGCARLLPPEKWFGYPGCRASEILPAFGEYIRQKSDSVKISDFIFIDEDFERNINNQKKHKSAASIDGKSFFINKNKINSQKNSSNKSIQISFSVRTVGSETGQRKISNLGMIQSFLRRTIRLPHNIHNISFENMSAKETINSISKTHIFVSVHGKLQ